MKKTRNEKGLLPEGELRDRMIEHLYSKRPILGKDSVFTELLQNMVNEMLLGEMDYFMTNTKIKRASKNKRNGTTSKKVLSSIGKLAIETPRDRNGEFEPQILQKRERNLTSGLDEQILALYAQGNSIEDIRRLLAKFYGITISAGKISMITDRVHAEVEAWRSRPLDSFYSILFLDAIRFNVRHEGKYSSRAFYTLYGTNADGERDLLGMYIMETEGANRWGIVLEDLVKRGVEDILIICTDNLTGFSNAIKEVFPNSLIQKCIVHQVRNSLKFCDYKDYREVVKDLKKIYQSSTREQAQAGLTMFEKKWDTKYSRIGKSWRANWDELMTYIDYPKALRKLIYTTNSVEALHRIIRKLVKSKAAWVSENALIKQIYLSLMQNEKSWKRKTMGWKSISRILIEEFGDRYQKQISDN
jgi:transposase-like protein